MLKKIRDFILSHRAGCALVVVYCIIFITVFSFAFISANEDEKAKNKNESESSLNTARNQASDVLGQADFTSAVSGTTAQNFAGEMTGVTIDEAEHRLFVGDYSNRRVLIFKLDDSNKLADKTADYVIGQPDFTSNKAGTSQATFAGPTGIAYDAARKRLFVSDGYGSNNRILVFDLSQGITNGMNASNVLGQSDFTSNSPRASRNGLQDNGSVSFDKTNNRLFVADYGNSRVLVFDFNRGITNGMDASYILGQDGSGSPTASSMNNPWGVHFDVSNNRLFVADFSNNRILVFDLSQGITNGMNASNVLGQQNFTINSPATTQNGMNNPLAITTDKSGDLLFVHDGTNARVLVFDTASLQNGENAIDVIGKPTFTGSKNKKGDYSNLFSAEFDCKPSRTELCFDGFDASMYFDSNNRTLYVSDSSNHRVLIFENYAPKPETHNL